ncbi:hypothetical protein PTTG_06462 [Puccinia triticina 1-1 BBBD Race 1]|uniref:Uncharacterized protein n=2 Tax=Puccinia triticina TaxID=208348 RepID=A0A0C4F046_PUCT1|nr:uncharacterized protein PtA15_6A816 [Puccinia triticina]OAV97070.1 hypothetical protein PTTG_06462 [Puccinia triticina 1-1 BBBD Race 1]WAQ86184.1 hypothetical protein PtA15_6A816 [Puccinia triticina]
MNSASNLQNIEILNSLYKELLLFGSLDEFSNASDAEFQLKSLRSLLRLGDYVAESVAVPAVFAKIEIFKPTTVVNLVELHTKLLFHKLGNNFFDSLDSVIPEIEFLESGAAMVHFHRSIKALPAADKQRAVQVVLKTILSHAPENFPMKGSPSPQYAQISEGFLQDEFLETEYITNLMKVFEIHEKLATSAGKRIEYQLVYYILDFINQYHQKVMQKHMGYGWKKDSSNFDRELDFMRRYLKKYRNRFLDRRYTDASQDLGDFIGFESARTDYGSNPFLFWIFTVLTGPFEHQNWDELFKDPGEMSYTLWMREIGRGKLHEFLRNVPDEQLSQYLPLSMAKGVPIRPGSSRRKTWISAKDLFAGGAN